MIAVFWKKRGVQKKGEVTTFVIVGIIIVVLAVTLFFARNTVLFRNLISETQKTITVPEQAKIVKVQVESCIRDTIKDGADLMMSRGGYIVIPTDPMPRGPANMFSNYVDIFNEGSSTVPYWYYQAANGVDKVQVPEMNAVRSQLENYLNSNIVDCLDRFSLLRGRGYEIAYSEPKSRVSILDDEIKSDVAFSIDLRLRDFNFEFDDFSVSVESGLGRMYKAARDVLSAENEKNFLENYALDSMVVYDSIPFSGVDFECSPRTWQRSKVIEAMKNVFATNIPAIKVKDSDYVLADDFDKYFVSDIGKDYEDLSFQFFYSPEWPLAIDILGEDGEILRGKPFASESTVGKFVNQFFCANNYHFVYNIKFPVIVVLRDGASGEVFQFATQVVIDHNQPRQNKINIPTLELETEICDKEGAESTIYVLGYRPDGSVGSLPDARVSLKCLNEVCEIGRTTWNGEDYSIRANVPACFNGIITADKEGYVGNKEMVSTSEGSSMSLILEKLYDLDVEVMVVSDSGVSPAQPTEQVIFTFDNKNVDYSTSLIVPGMKTVKLAPGNYEVRVSTLVQSSGFTIPAKEIKSCVDAPREGLLGLAGLTEKKCVNAKADEVKLDQAMVGGSTYSWSVSRSELADSKKIILYAPRGPMPRSISELAKSSESDSKIVRMPTLS